MNYIRCFFIGFLEGLKEFGHLISDVINFVLLSFVYIIGVGITSLLDKLFKKSFLDKDLKEGKSYWSELNLKKKPIDEYYRQF